MEENEEQRKTNALEIFSELVEIQVKYEGESAQRESQNTISLLSQSNNAFFQFTQMSQKSSHFVSTAELLEQMRTKVDFLHDHQLLRIGVHALWREKAQHSKLTFELVDLIKGVFNGCGSENNDCRIDFIYILVGCLNELQAQSNFTMQLISILLREIQLLIPISKYLPPLIQFILKGMKSVLKKIMKCSSSVGDLSNVPEKLQIEKCNNLVSMDILPALLIYLSTQYNSKYSKDSDFGFEDSSGNELTRKIVERLIKFLRSILLLQISTVDNDKSDETDINNSNVLLLAFFRLFTNLCLSEDEENTFIHLLLDYFKEDLAKQQSRASSKNNIAVLPHFSYQILLFIEKKKTNRGTEGCKYILLVRGLIDYIDTKIGLTNSSTSIVEKSVLNMFKLVYQQQSSYLGQLLLDVYDSINSSTREGIVASNIGHFHLRLILCMSCLSKFHQSVFFFLQDFLGMYNSNYKDEAVYNHMSNGSGKESLRMKRVSPWIYSCYIEPEWENSVLSLTTSQGNDTMSKTFNSLHERRRFFFLNSLFHSFTLKASSYNVNGVVLGEEILESLVQFGFYLLSSQEQRTSLQFGEDLLKNLFERHKVVREAVLRQLSCHLQLTDTTTTKHLYYIKVLHSFFSGQKESTVNEVFADSSCFRWIKECFDAFIHLCQKTNHVHASIYLLQACTPLLYNRSKSSSILKDHLILILRKAIFCNEPLVRATSILGIVHLLSIESNCTRNHDLGGLIKVLLSDRENAVSETRSTSENSIRSFHQFLGLFRRGLTQQFEVRSCIYLSMMHLYTNSSDASMKEYLLNSFLYPHLRHYYYDTNPVTLPPLFHVGFDLTVTSSRFQNESVAFLLHSNLACWRCQDIHNAEMQEAMQNLMNRLKQTDLSDFGWDKTIAFDDQNNQATAFEIISIYETTMNHIILSAGGEITEVDVKEILHCFQNLWSLQLKVLSFEEFANNRAMKISRKLEQKAASSANSKINQHMYKNFGNSSFHSYLKENNPFLSISAIVYLLRVLYCPNEKAESVRKLLLEHDHFASYVLLKCNAVLKSCNNNDNCTHLLSELADAKTRTQFILDVSPMLMNAFDHHYQSTYNTVSNSENDNENEDGKKRPKKKTPRKVSEEDSGRNKNHDSTVALSGLYTALEPWFLSGENEYTSSFPNIASKEQTMHLNQLVCLLEHILTVSCATYMENNEREQDNLMVKLEMQSLVFQGLVKRLLGNEEVLNRQKTEEACCVLLLILREVGLFFPVGSAERKRLAAFFQTLIVETETISLTNSNINMLSNPNRMTTRSSLMQCSNKTSSLLLQRLVDSMFLFQRNGETSDLSEVYKLGCGILLYLHENDLISAMDLDEQSGHQDDLMKDLVHRYNLLNNENNMFVVLTCILQELELHLLSIESFLNLQANCKKVFQRPKDTDFIVYNRVVQVCKCSLPLLANSLANQKVTLFLLRNIVLKMYKSVFNVLLKTKIKAMKNAGKHNRVLGRPFRDLLDMVTKSFSRRVLQFISFIQQEQNNRNTSLSLNRKRKKPRSAPSGGVGSGGNALIPEIICQVEIFDAHLIKLSKLLPDVNFNKWFRRRQARDFRIQIDVVQERIGTEDKENRNNDPDGNDSSDNSSVQKRKKNRVQDDDDDDDETTQEDDQNEE